MAQRGRFSYLVAQELWGRGCLPLCATLYVIPPKQPRGDIPPLPLVTYNNRLPWNSNLAALSGEYSSKTTLLIQSELVVAAIHLKLRWRRKISDT